jgi:hypothetical protein
MTVFNIEVFEAALGLNTQVRKVQMLLSGSRVDDVS